MSELRIFERKRARSEDYSQIHLPRGFKEWQDVGLSVQTLMVAV